MSEPTKGVPIEFLGKNSFENRSFHENLEIIIEEVKKGKILIMDNSLNPQKKKKLIEKSMESIDDDFSGIEFTSLETGDFIDKALNKIYMLLGKDRRRGLTIVGNSKAMRKVKEDKESVSFVAKDVERKNAS